MEVDISRYTLDDVRLENVYLEVIGWRFHWCFQFRLQSGIRDKRCLTLHLAYKPEKWRLFREQAQRGV